LTNVDEGDSDTQNSGKSNDKSKMNGTSYNISQLDREITVTNMNTDSIETIIKLKSVNAVWDYFEKVMQSIVFPYQTDKGYRNWRD